MGGRDQRLRMSRCSHRFLGSADWCIAVDGHAGDHVRQCSATRTSDPPTEVTRCTHRENHLGTHVAEQCYERDSNGARCEKDLWHYGDHECPQQMAAFQGKPFQLRAGSIEFDADQENLGHLPRRCNAQTIRQDGRTIRCKHAPGHPIGQSHEGVLQCDELVDYGGVGGQCELDDGHAGACTTSARVPLTVQVEGEWAPGVCYVCSQQRSILQGLSVPMCKECRGAVVLESLRQSLDTTNAVIDQHEAEYTLERARQRSL